MTCISLALLWTFRRWALEFGLRFACSGRKEKANREVSIGEIIEHGRSVKSRASILDDLPHSVVINVSDGIQVQLPGDVSGVAEGSCVL